MNHPSNRAQRLALKRKKFEEEKERGSLDKPSKIRKKRRDQFAEEESRNELQEFRKGNVPG